MFSISIAEADNKLEVEGSMQGMPNWSVHIILIFDSQGQDILDSFAFFLLCKILL
jgi:hypothetical protein